MTSVSALAVKESSNHFTAFDTADIVELPISVRNVPKAMATKRVGSSICREKKMTKILTSSSIHYESSMWMLSHTRRKMKLSRTDCMSGTVLRSGLQS